MCAGNLALCVGYWAFERSVPKQYRPLLGKDARIQEGWSKRYFGLKSLYQLCVEVSFGHHKQDTDRIVRSYSGCYVVLVSGIIDV